MYMPSFSTNVSKIISQDDLEARLTANGRDGYEYRERRHEDWKDNYELFRDKVIVNRLTQRQSVNIPLMKQIVKTLLSKIDDFIDLEFTNLDNDKQKELFYSLYWTDVVKKDNRIELKDKVDKKQVMLFGRTFEKLNVLNNKVKFHIIDPQDVRIDRFVDPTDIDTARYIIQDNIYETLSDLKANAAYDQTAVAQMEAYFKTDIGVIHATENAERLQEKNDAMRDLGDNYVDDPLVNQTIVQLQEGFTKVYNPEYEEDEIIFTLSGNIEMDDQPKTLILFADTLEHLIDPNNNCPDHFWRTHYPLESWGEDVENRDFWCDGVADSIRVPNKIVNSWFSQTVENRTLRNFGMNYYNSSLGDEDGAFIPQMFEPRAWGWYPIPGNPNDLIKSIEIPQLTGNLEEINFVVQIAEKASAATAITQGVPETKRITLGEVQLLSSNAMDRIQSMSLYYQQAWLNIGIKYIKILEAMGDQIEAVKLFKKGYRGNVFNQKISPNNWKAKLGYNVRVISKKDKSVQDLEQIQKLNAVKNFMPTNIALTDIIKKKLLDVGGLNPDEVRSILEEEAKNPSIPNPLTMVGGGKTPTPAIASPPAQPASPTAPRTPVPATPPALPISG